MSEAPAAALSQWNRLEDRLLDAHRRDDTATLCAIYTEAADIVERDGRIDEACFYLTQGFVLALERGAPEKDELHRRLVAHGRIKEIGQ